MRPRIANRLIAGIGIAAIVLCGSAASASANPPPDKKQHQKQNQQKPKPAQPHEKPVPQHGKPAQQHAPAQNANPAARQARPQEPHGRQAQAHPPQPPAPQAPQKAQPPEPARRQPQAQARHEGTPTRPQPQPHQGAAPRGERSQPARVAAAPAPVRVDSTRRGRLAPQQQQVLVSQQQRRITEYRADLGQARRAAEQQSVELQQQHRTAQYRFTQGYVSRLQQQEAALQNYREYDYDSDPYFYTPADYRYYRGDRYYETNEYGVALLRTALNNGYREGWLAGTADREDGWQSSYRSCYAYRDANYGYNGYYLDRATYNYYFREGFRRGYEDGYDRRYRYGRYSNGTRSLLGSVLTVVLRIEHIA